MGVLSTLAGYLQRRGKYLCVGGREPFYYRREYKQNGGNAVSGARAKLHYSNMNTNRSTKMADMIIGVKLVSLGQA